MWQRFTERARRVVFFAQEEAGRYGHGYVDTEHLFLGLLREEDSVACRILVRRGVNLNELQRTIVNAMKRGKGRNATQMQLTVRAKRVIDLAYDEARLLMNNYIGTEHLLLALVREGEGLASKTLVKSGVNLEQLREEVVALQENDVANRSEPPPTQRHAAKNPVSVEAVELRKKITEDVAGWRNKSCVSLFDVSTAQLEVLLEVAAGLKALDLARQMAVAWTYPRTLAMIFEKPSLRTRVSFEASMAHLRGHAINLSVSEIGLGTRESTEDVAGVLSRWVDVISARVFQHETVVELAKYATIPVINALSDAEHPIQAFADLLTMQEKCGALGNGLKLAYVGDGNNVLHALLLACAMVGIHVSAGCPEGYMPDSKYVDRAREIGQETGAIIEITTDPVQAVTGANAVYADVWTSMGQEAEREERLNLFAGYQVNDALMAHAKPDAIVLHCLPAHRGEEISESIMSKHGATIYEQAENRLHTQKALLMLIIGL